MACPPISPPHCRQDQFLVEVRGHKSCCYSYLCGRFFFTVYFCWIFFTNKTLQMLNNLAFFCPNSVWVMYRAHSLLLSWRNSLSGPEHHQQLLSTVLLWCVFVFEKEKKKTTQNKTTLRLFPFLSVCSKPKLQCFAVCDVNLCPESSVSCAAGLSLVQTHVPGLCCPQYHCGTHTQTDTYQYTTFNSWCFIILYNFVFVFFTVFVKYRMQVWGWLSLKLSSGKKAKINNTTH